MKVLDYGYDRDTDIPFFVMERIDGGDLTSQIGTMALSEALRVFADVLLGIQVAHKNDVIHSDVSPDNILFDKATKKYKLNDFGLAKLLTSTLMSRGASVSMTGGKPGYLPVDQWHTGERNQFTDLYGLCVTIVNLVTKTIPKWTFDFKSGTLSGPDLAALFQNPTGKVLISSVSDDVSAHIFPVLASVAGFDSWRHTGYLYGYKYLTHITDSEFVELLSLIVRREIMFSDEAFLYLQKCSSDYGKAQEDAWLKKKADEEALKAQKQKEAKRGKRSGGLGCGSENKI